MATKKDYQSITVYKDMAPQVLELTDEEAGKVYKAIFRFSCYGENSDFSEQDRFVRSLWETTKLKLKAGEEHSKKISEINRENVKKRWEEKKTDTNEYDRIKPDTNEYDRTTYTDTVTGTNSFTPTISSTVTKTEQKQACAVADSVNRLSVSAAAVAEPPTGDLFSVSKLNEIVNKNNIGLSDEGIKIFHEEMQESGWTLYKKPVEKKFIARSLREWSKKHVEFHKNLGECSNGIQNETIVSHSQIEGSIRLKSEKYISKRRFAEAEDKDIDFYYLLSRYCPKEAFSAKEVKFIERKFEIGEWKFRAKDRVAKDKYLEDE